jgi:hypothetical protein
VVAKSGGPAQSLCPAIGLDEVRVFVRIKYVPAMTTAFALARAAFFCGASARAEK